MSLPRLQYMLAYRQMFPRTASFSFREELPLYEKNCVLQLTTDMTGSINQRRLKVIALRVKYVVCYFVRSKGLNQSK